MRKSTGLIPVLAALSACATAPTPLKGEFSTLTPSASLQGDHSGERVRWGGEIISVEPRESETCFKLLTRELDAAARPRTRDSSDGRFIACRAGFYDPEVFTKGRELTVVGSVDGSEVRKIGEFEYTYPKVAADAIYLWATRPLVIEQRSAWPYDPFWGPSFGPWWGGGFWGAPPLIIVNPHSQPGHGGKR